uniref:Uncharacterized protein n=1 Tax=Cannabis sativa TaxID=3483 RepID=A0A803QIH2_CANSA
MIGKGRISWRPEARHLGLALPVMEVELQAVYAEVAPGTHTDGSNIGPLVKMTCQTRFRPGKRREVSCIGLKGKSKVDFSQPNITCDICGHDGELGCENFMNGEGALNQLTLLVKTHGPNKKNLINGLGRLSHVDDVVYAQQFHCSSTLVGPNKSILVGRHCDEVNVTKEEPLASDKVENIVCAKVDTVCSQQVEKPISSGQSARLTMWKAKARLMDISVSIKKDFLIKDEGSAIGTSREYGPFDFGTPFFP